MRPGSLQIQHFHAVQLEVSRALFGPFGKECVLALRVILRGNSRRDGRERLDHQVLAVILSDLANDRVGLLDRRGVEESGVVAHLRIGGANERRHEQQRQRARQHYQYFF
jgi:hypothetical protein